MLACDFPCLISIDSKRQHKLRTNLLQFLFNTIQYAIQICGSTRKLAWAIRGGWRL